MIRQWEKTQIPHLRNRSGNFIIKWFLLGYWSWFGSNFWSVTCMCIKVIWRRMTSSEVKKRVFANNSGMKLQTRALSHCVPLVKTHRLICNMTYLGHHVTSRDLDLRLNFFTWPFNVNKHMFRRALMGGTRWCLNLAASMLSSKVIRKNFFVKKGYFGVFRPLAAKPLTLAQIWWHLSERTAQELSNAFSGPSN